MDDFMEQHQDVLQNIESAILGVYREKRELADYQVDSALEALGRTYAGEARGKAPVLPKNPLALEVYQAMKSMCDWRMGRENVVDEEGQPMSADGAQSVDEILVCLKRLRKSVETWSKKGGSQGYLHYISQFIP
jgi:hypothetical protein